MLFHRAVAAAALRREKMLEATRMKGNFLYLIGLFFVAHSRERKKSSRF
jgi:hypothetical protein